jgi:hypothetical protein
MSKEKPSKEVLRENFMREYERDLAMYDDYADKLHLVDEGKYKKWLKKHLPKMSFESIKIRWKVFIHRVLPYKIKIVLKRVEKGEGWRQ